ncbi:MAG: hypothetical protein RL595_1144 [Planctomycetota bacterium]
MTQVKSRFKIRFLLVMLMMFITVVTGGTIILVNFFLETKQAESDVNAKLRLISEDVNNLTEAFLNHVSGRTFSIGTMMESSIIDFKKPEQIIHVGLEMLKNQKKFASFQMIDAATGSMVFIGRDSEEKIFSRTVYKDEKTGLFHTMLQENLNSAESRPSLVDKNSVDPRENPIYQVFRETKTPDWTEVSPPPEHGHKGAQQTFSYVYPVLKNEVFLGIARIEVGLGDISNYLSSQGAKIGFEGSAFILERKLDGKVIVIGHENHVHQLHHSNGDLLLANECTDYRVQALQKILTKYSNSKLDIFNIPTTMSEKATDKRGKLWNIAWTSVFPNQKPYWIVVTAASNDLLMAEAYNHILASVLILGVIILGGIFLVFIIARRLSNPLELISADILKVGQWEITARPTDQYQVLEMFNLANGIEEMKTGLLSFRKYIPGDVVRQVVHSRKTAKIFVEKKNITVFFSDLKNFTSMSESLDPDVLVSILGEHLAFCSSIIHKNKGTIDKFIGDSVMAFWNAPLTIEDHATMACKAALECQIAMNSFNKANLSKGLPEIVMRIGINTGDALVGNIGSDTRLNYTAVGDTVNLASRLEGTNKEYGTLVLINETTNREVSGKILTRLVDKVAVKGKTKPGEIYEVLANAEDESPKLRKIIDLTSQGRVLFEARQFSKARECYGQLLEMNPDDGVARLYQQRCDHFMANPPPADWDAVTHRDTK